MNVRVRRVPCYMNPPHGLPCSSSRGWGGIERHQPIGRAASRRALDGLACLPVCLPTCWRPGISQLNSLFSKGLPKAAVDRPQNVEGCSASSAAAAAVRRHRHADALTGVERQQSKSSPVAATGRCPKPSLWLRKDDRRRNKMAAPGQEVHPERGLGVGGVTALSLAELCPPFFGDRERAIASTPSPPRSRQRVVGNDDHRRNENTMPPRPCPESGDGSPVSPYKRNAALPTVGGFTFPGKCARLCVCLFYFSTPSSLFFFDGGKRAEREGGGRGGRQK